MRAAMFSRAADILLFAAILLLMAAKDIFDEMIRADICTPYATAANTAMVERCSLLRVISSYKSEIRYACRYAYIIDDIARTMRGSAARDDATALPYVFQSSSSFFRYCLCCAVGERRARYTAMVVPFASAIRHASDGAIIIIEESVLRR